MPAALAAAAVLATIWGAPRESSGPRVTAPIQHRTQHHADPAVQLALQLVGQPLNPVAVVDLERARRIHGHPAGLGISGQVLAFRALAVPHDPFIYLISSGPSYRDAAREPTPRAILRLAATLVHEQVHNTDGEAAARRIQADFVRSRLDGLRGGDRRAAERYHESLESSAVAHQRAAVLARDFQRARR